MGQKLKDTRFMTNVIVQDNFKICVHARSIDISTIGYRVLHILVHVYLHIFVASPEDIQKTTLLNYRRRVTHFKTKTIPKSLLVMHYRTVMLYPIIFYLYMFYI